MTSREGATSRFSFARWWSIVLKEFLQLRRDRAETALERAHAAPRRHDHRDDRRLIRPRRSARAHGRRPSAQASRRST